MNEITRNALVSIAREMVAKKQTGSLLLSVRHDHARRSAIIAIDNGKIISLSYGVKRGMAALPLLQAIDTCSCKFNEMVLGRPIIDLLETNALLDAIQSSQLVIPQSIKPSSEFTSGSGFNQIKAIEILEQQLTLIIGPVASMILDDALEELGEITNINQFKKLVKFVANDALEGQERTKFPMDVLNKVIK